MVARVAHIMGGQFRCNQWLLLLLLLIAPLVMYSVASFNLCVLASSVQMPSSEEDDTNKDQTYGVIVDCGSSGTRANIYQWDTALGYPELLHDIGPMHDPVSHNVVSTKFKPGISSFADKSEDELHEHIKQVADFIAEKIPSDRHAFTVVYMFATAGMRLLDDDDQKRIMEEVRSYVEKNYNFRSVTTSVISGGDEGLYRWISVNNKKKRFLGQHTNGKTKTFGVIEMGGASLQVVYQLRLGHDDLIANGLKTESLRAVYLNQIVEPQISRHDKNESTYKLHSTTFLGFGGDSAYQAYLDLLIRDHYSNDFIKRFLRTSGQVLHRFLNCFNCHGPFDVTDKRRLLTIKDPCAPMGFRSDKIEKPRRMLKTESKTIGFLVEDEDRREKEGVFRLRLVGTGDYNKCKRLVERMLRLAKKEGLNCKRNEHCTMDLVGEPFVPFDVMDFVGVGDFYYTTNNRMLGLDGQYIHQSVVRETKKICNMSLKALKSRYSDIAKDDTTEVRERIHSQCFRAVWMDTFLVKGLLMPTHFRGLTTLKKINGEEPDWQLGAVLDKSLAIEEVTEENLLRPNQVDLLG